jgi:hypothetical protein
VEGGVEEPIYFLHLPTSQFPQEIITLHILKLMRALVIISVVNGENHSSSRGVSLSLNESEDGASQTQDSIVVHAYLCIGRALMLCFLIFDVLPDNVGESRPGMRTEENENEQPENLRRDKKIHKQSERRCDIILLTNLCASSFRLYALLHPHYLPLSLIPLVQIERLVPGSKSRVKGWCGGFRCLLSIPYSA